MKRKNQSTAIENNLMKNTHAVRRRWKPKFEKANEELSLAKEDATDKLCKLDGAKDEELGLSCPPSPKNDTKSETKERWIVQS